MDIEHTFEAEDSINRDLLLAQSFPNHEAAPLRASLHQQEGLIGKLDSQISVLKSQMKVLGRRRRAVVESIVLKKALLAPVRRLAPEILAEIFGWCIDKSLNISIKTAPLLLLQVCSQWRGVVIGTPNLWTQLAMRWPSEINVDPRMVVPMWLHNSRSLPINIYIDTAGWCYPKTHRPILIPEVKHILDDISRSISSHLEHIKTLHCEGPKAKRVLKTIRPPDGRLKMPLLQELTLIPSSLDGLAPPKMDRIIISPDLRILDIPYGFIVELHEVHLFNLKSLSIRWEIEETQTIIDFLAKFSNNSLESFALIRRSSDPIRFPALASFLEGFLSSSTLKKLTLTGTALSHEDTKKILVALPTLESLSISHDQVDPDILCLNPGDSTTWILPRLSSISIDATSTQAANIIKSRAVNYHWALDKVEGFQKLTYMDLDDDERCSKFQELRTFAGGIDGFLLEPKGVSNDDWCAYATERQRHLQYLEDKLLHR